MIRLFHQHKWKSLELIADPIGIRYIELMECDCGKFATIVYPADRKVRS